MKSGSRIAGYWVWWPFHGEEFARRFETEEDAKAYLPIKKNNKGRGLPLGPRVIYRVGWSRTNVWSYDKIEDLSQEEVDELFYEAVKKAIK